MVEYILGNASAIAILLSATVAVLIAKKTVCAQRAIARRRATLDIIHKLQLEPEYQKAVAVFRDVRDSGRLVDLIATDNSERSKEEHHRVFTFLNHYELICCGIQEDTLDELFYFKWYRSAFIQHWNESAELIKKTRIQSGNKRAFERFEFFATSWENDTFVTINNHPPSFYMKNHRTVEHDQDVNT